MVLVVMAHGDGEEAVDKLFPASSPNDLAHEGLGEPIFSRQTSNAAISRDILSSERVYDLPSKDSPRVDLSGMARIWDFAASFCISIYRIIARSPKKQMVWSDAFHHVASVTYKKVFGYLPIMEFPRQSMGQRLFAINPDRSISGLFRSSPKPACFRFIYITPKTLHAVPLSDLSGDFN